MRCGKIQNDLSAFVDGELPPSRNAEVEAHVASCGTCRRRVAELKKLASGVAAMPRLQPTSEFLAEVRRKLDTPMPKQESWVDVMFRPYWVKLPAEALAVMIVVGVTLMFVQPRRAMQVASNEASAGARAPLQKAETDAVKLKDGKTDVAHVLPPPTVNRGVEAPAAPTPSLGMAGPKEESEVAMAGNGIVLALGSNTESVTVVADDFVALQTRAVAIARELAGNIVPSTAAVDRAHTLYVVVPTESVETFKRQLLVYERLGSVASMPPPVSQPMRQSRGRDVNAALDRADVGQSVVSSNAAAASATTGRPMSVIEIKVVPSGQ